MIIVILLETHHHHHVPFSFTTESDLVERSDHSGSLGIRTLVIAYEKLVIANHSVGGTVIRIIASVSNPHAILCTTQFLVTISAGN